ncbi:copper homeostasis protein CutC [Allobaculum sp. JKK-2023]|uniref:copper homeostasis protein CutC n=1 Tax=Allobaculum sp. JKK-2023 TaxID=3108943 RepID=UPI002B05978E|nr:copper homeostasis protein CutC [Allobaculum sp. JKK-2023]
MTNQNQLTQSTHPIQSSQSLQTLQSSFPVVEVCTGSYEDCLAAANGGADRVELNSALALGGLSPTEATLKAVKRDTDLQVICMVRPRAAGFHYNDLEKKIMFEEARSFLANGADGIAFGFLEEDGQIDQEATRKMIDLIHHYGKEAVFHRAIDVTPDYEKAFEILCELGADRVLTSGQMPKAMDGMPRIAAMQQKFGDQIQILAGSGMNASNAKEMIEKTGIHQIHSSCKSYACDPTTTGNAVSYAYLEGAHHDDYDTVSENLVRNLVGSLRPDHSSLKS